tara:strand:- start:366 stop:1259 length:894 start_codon:yes stop_codon:yes gene_type:complete
MATLEDIGFNNETMFIDGDGQIRLRDPNEARAMLAANEPNFDLSNYTMSTFPVTNINQSLDGILGIEGVQSVNNLTKRPLDKIDTRNNLNVSSNLMQSGPLVEVGLTELGEPIMGTEAPTPTNRFSIDGLKDFIMSGGITGNILRGIGSLVTRDPRQAALDKFYSDQSRNTAGTLTSGLMAGYNPVSGGLLNMITGGRLGDPTTFGLQRAYQKRIDTIKNTLKRKESEVLEARLAQLEAEKARELQALQTAQKEKDRRIKADAYATQLGDRYTGGENTRSARTTGNYDDPFNPGFAD